MDAGSPDSDRKVYESQWTRDVCRPHSDSLAVLLRRVPACGVGYRFLAEVHHLHRLYGGRGKGGVSDKMSMREQLLEHVSWAHGSL